MRNLERVDVVSEEYCRDAILNMLDDGMRRQTLIATESNLQVMVSAFYRSTSLASKKSMMAVWSLICQLCR